MICFPELIKNPINGKTCLYFVGQAGFIIQSANGCLIAIDLYLSDCVEKDEGHMGYKRLLPKILSPSDIEFDYIITTHSHLDHYDADSIPYMMCGTKTRLFASMGCNIYEDRCDNDKNRITYVEPGYNYKEKDFNIHFVSCDHGASMPDAVGVIIRVDNKNIYITGDTCLRLDRIAEYKKFGEIDALIGPINGAYGNMNEYEFAELSRALSPKLTIPCHYGMFASHGGNPGTFINAMNEQNSNYILMSMGERLVL